MNTRVPPIFHDNANLVVNVYSGSRYKGEGQVFVGNFSEFLINYKSNTELVFPCGV